MSSRQAESEVQQEIRDLQIRTLEGLFRWCAYVISVLTATFVATYLLHAGSAELALACAFGTFQLSLPWAWRVLRRGEVERAQRFFLVAASGVVTAYLLFTPPSIMLVGVMGIFLFIRLTTAFEPQQTMRLGLSWVMMFVLSVACRIWLDLDSIRLGGAESFVIIALPVAVTVLFAQVDGYFGHKLEQVLGRSEHRRRDLRAANEVLEEQKARLNELSAKQEQVNHELTLANDDLRSFTYAVSHDLRAPLINIRGFASELNKELATLGPICEAQLDTMNEADRKEASRALKQEIPEALRFIESSVERMDALITGILKLSRIGRRELQLEVVDAAAVVQSTLASLQHRIQAREVTVRVEPLPALRTDALALTQIFSNLLANAIAYLEPGRPGVVTVAAEHDELGRVRFAVRDNGRGIAPDDQKAIFQLFRRVGPRTEQGEGMGLTYVDALVRRLGGNVWCESTLGVGSTFYFTLHAGASEPGKVDP